MYSGSNGMCKAFCPHDCPSDSTKCPGGTDSNGCPMADTCIPLTKGNDGIVCPVSCPVQCPKDHFSCDGGMDENGCKKPNTCVANQGRYYKKLIYISSNS